jgi:hypothetical protein
VIDQWLTPKALADVRWMWAAAANEDEQEALRQLEIALDDLGLVKLVKRYVLFLHSKYFAFKYN